MTESPVTNALTSICSPDSLGKEGSFPLFLFAIIFVFPVFKKKQLGGEII